MRYFFLVVKTACWFGRVYRSDSYFVVCVCVCVPVASEVSERWPNLCSTCEKSCALFRDAVKVSKAMIWFNATTELFI